MIGPRLLYAAQNVSYIFLQLYRLVTDLQGFEVEFSMNPSFQPIYSLFPCRHVNERKRRLTVGLEDTEDLVTGNRLDLGNSVRVTENDTDLRRDELASFSSAAPSTLPRLSAISDRLL